MKVEYFNPDRALKMEKITSVTEFLFNELGQFGDPRDAIAKAIHHAMDKSHNNGGGLVAVMSDSNQIIGAAVINRTGMEDYIPEHILVYIAIHHHHRGQRLGKFLLLAALKQIDGDIALHVEPDNPAIHLYKSLGFTNKYIEMRLSRKE